MLAGARLRPVNRVTIRDLGAAALALVALAGVILLAALGKPIPDVLIVIGSGGGFYFLRGAENGGLVPKLGGPK